MYLPCVSSPAFSSCCFTDASNLAFCLSDIGNSFIEDIILSPALTWDTLNLMLSDFCLSLGLLDLSLSVTVELSDSFLSPFSVPTSSSSSSSSSAKKYMSVNKGFYIKG